jgi:hypothetical protein
MFTSSGMDEKLLRYPYVVVRIGCEACVRQGSYRLARLAAKYGAEVTLPELLMHLTTDCPLRNARHPYQGTCRARFIDLDPPMPPPNLPQARLRLVKKSA